MYFTGLATSVTQQIVSHRLKGSSGLAALHQFACSTIVRLVLFALSKSGIAVSYGIPVIR
jgi:hypothetical protein